MDLGTVMLLLSVGSFLFAFLLMIFKFNKNNPQNVPFWIAAKILQGCGSLMLYFRTTDFDALTITANTTLLLGCAYEAYAVGTLVERKISRRHHLLTSLAIMLVCVLTVFISGPARTGTFFLMQSILYFLPSVFLFRSEIKYSLQSVMAVCYSVAGTVFLIASALCLFTPDISSSLANKPIAGAIPGVSFCIFLISGFILLMLAKERSDLQVKEIQKTLKKNEIRFQKIVETANEGIIVFDENFKIIFANSNMASILGYTVEEMAGRAYISFFSEDNLPVYDYQISLRKKGYQSTYECALLTKIGESHWFLVSAKAIMDELGVFEGSFAMLTDINERKEKELQLTESNKRLTELSNKDSLTGIGNRRLFDEKLEIEYKRHIETNSPLSIILFDIDHFKEYNDCYGHVTGDDCLRKIGSVLQDALKNTAYLAARYGGEEFACILPDTDLKTAVKVSEKIKRKIHELKIEHTKSKINEFVTASFGVITAKSVSDASPKELVDMADKLLYKAKMAGRNKIEYAES